MVAELRFAKLHLHKLPDVWNQVEMFVQEAQQQISNGPIRVQTWSIQRAVRERSCCWTWRVLWLWRFQPKITEAGFCFNSSLNKGRHILIHVFIDILLRQVRRFPFTKKQARTQWNVLMKTNASDWVWTSPCQDNKSIQTGFLRVCSVVLQSACRVTAVTFMSSVHHQHFV